TSAGSRFVLPRLRQSPFPAFSMTFSFDSCTGRLRIAPLDEKPVTDSCLGSSSSSLSESWRSAVRGAAFEGRGLRDGVVPAPGAGAAGFDLPKPKEMGFDMAAPNSTRVDGRWELEPGTDVITAAEKIDGRLAYSVAVGLKRLAAWASPPSPV